MALCPATSLLDSFIIKPVVTKLALRLQKSTFDFQHSSICCSALALLFMLIVLTRKPLFH